MAKKEVEEKVEERFFVAASRQDWEKAWDELTLSFLRYPAGDYFLDRWYVIELCTDKDKVVALITAEVDPACLQGEDDVLSEHVLMCCNSLEVWTECWTDRIPVDLPAISESIVEEAHKLPAGIRIGHVEIDKARCQHLEGYMRKFLTGEL